MRTLLELAEVRAEQDHQRVGFTWSTDREELPVTYGDLVRRSAALAAALIAETSPGDRVLIMHPQGRDYLVSLLACVQAGCIAVPAFPPTTDRLDRRLDSMVRDSGAALGLVSSAVIERMGRATGSRSSGRLRLVATDELDGGDAEPLVDRRPGADDPAFLQYTSGSTSAPKGVVITHVNLLHNLEQIGRRFGHHRDSVGVIWLPPFHDMGLIGGLLAPLHGAFPVTLLTPVAFLRSPARWLETISRVGGTISGGPSFAYDLCVQRVTDEQVEALDLSSWAVAFNGAEPVDAAAIDRFAQRFAPFGFRRESFYPCYGLAEATLLVTGGTAEMPPLVRSFDREALRHGRARATGASDDDSGSRGLVGCGRPIDDQIVVIVDPDAQRAVDDGTVGEIWVAGPSVSAGYWKAPASGDPFGRSLAGHPGPLLRTGDHGFFHEGELFVTGRGSDLLIFRGQNHHPQDIELSVSLAHPDLRAHGGAAFSVPIDGEERLVVVQEVVRAARHAAVSELAAAARAAVSEEHGLQLHTLVLVRPGRVPRTTSNKVQRSACRDRFLADDLAPLGVSILEPRRNVDGSDPPAVTRREVGAGERAAGVELVVERLSVLAADVLGVGREAVGANRSLAELGVDSVGAVDLLHRIEDELDVSVPPSVAMGSSSIVALASWVVDEIRTGRVRATSSNDEASGGGIAVGEDALWILYNLAPESSAYTIAAALRFTSVIDVDRLERAVEGLIADHQALRVRFESSERGGAVRCSTPPMQVFRREDASGWSDVELDARTSAVANRPFDLDHGPIVRFHLFTRGDEHRLVFACHQIAADFWSVELLARELADRYEQGGRPVEVADIDAPALQRRSLGGAHLDRLRSYWAQQLAGPLPRLDLPLDRPRPAVQAYDGATARLELPGTVHTQVRLLAEQEGTTPFVVLLAAYSALLSRYTMDPDVIVGTPMANRPRELAQGIGFLANTVALRVDVATARSFRALVGRVRRTTLDALDHQAYPFAAVLQDMKQRRNLGRPGVFDTMFTMQQPRGAGAAGLDALALGVGGVSGTLGVLQFESVPLSRTGSQFDLTLMLADLGDRYAGALTYNRGLFDGATVERLSEQFRSIVAGAVDDPSRRPMSLRLSTPEEEEALRRASLGRSDRGSTVAPPFVHEAIERVAANSPAAVAVIDDAGSTTFGELLADVRHLRAQVSAAGAREGDPLAVLLPAGRGHVASMLALLGSRQPYLPLDPAWPSAHIVDVLEVAGATAIITDGERSTLVADRPELTVIPYEPSRDAATADDTSGGPADQLSAATACLFATSGSTGRPKLVAMSHGALRAQAAGIGEWIGARADDRQLVVESFAFAASIRQVLVPLSAGGAVVVARDIVGDAPAVMELARTSEVTILSALPSVLRHWADTVADLAPAERAQLVGDRVRLVLSASEHLSEVAATAIAACFPAARMYNLFGHTEVCGIATAHPIVPASDPSVGADVPIGTAVGAAEALILNDDLQPVPVGVPGILHIGGPVVATSYVGDPAGTAAAFVPNPFGPPGARLFRTGDVVRQRGGSFEFLGRQDGQLKVRGARVEPREVERALDRHPGVQASVVAGIPDGDDLRLVAYVEPVGEVPSASDLRRHAAALLPPGSVPSGFVTIDEWPRLPSGKVARRALPLPSTDRPVMDIALVLPRTPLEEQLAQIWTSVLPIDVVGVDDNFFDIGGTSLDAMVVHRRLRGGPAPDIRLVTVFQHASIAALARHMSGDQQESRHMERGSAAAARRRERLAAMRARTEASSTAGEP